MKSLVAGVMFLLLTMGVANAKQYSDVVKRYSGWEYHTPVASVSHHKRRHHIVKARVKTVRRAGSNVDPSYAVGGLVTVPTAADIPITVAKNLAAQFQGFIKDLVDEGYIPKHIGCWAPVGTHVQHSNHYHGGACDFDQTGRNKTARKMYHLKDLAAKWGFRDGCSFGDCGHIDDGRNVGWIIPTNIPNFIDQEVDYRPVVKVKLTP